MIDIAHIHPMLVHFPLALLPVALCAQLVAAFKGQGLFEHSCPSTIGVALIVVAAAGAIVAAVFGDIALDQAIASGVPADSLETHETLGQLSAVLLSALALSELWLYRKASHHVAVNRSIWVLELVVLTILLSTAWFGGQLVYDLGVNVTLPAS